MSKVPKQYENSLLSQAVTTGWGVLHLNSAPPFILATPNSLVKL